MENNSMNNSKESLKKEEVGLHGVGQRHSNTDSNESTWKYGLAWERSYEIGIEKIDDQHKQLFRLTSDLIEAFQEGRSAIFLSDALEFLASYTAQHFADEEALQLSVGYPDYKNHKKMHDDFAASVYTLIAEFKAGETEGLLEKVHSLVAHWLIKHVKNVDSKISMYL
ncbi:MAG: hemerythrin family protein [Clostridiales Family XIII bacterium]|jgi:hemerythrin-like metal-binding protein|nr:hemerythrin family protein [Clostridiales Family XIII bacterium]